jgi:hypothetical protein
MPVLEYTSLNSLLLIEVCFATPKLQYVNRTFSVLAIEFEGAPIILSPK